MIKWAVKYHNRFTVFGDEEKALKLTKALKLSPPIKVQEVVDAGGIDFSRIVGKIGMYWYVCEE